MFKSVILTLIALGVWIIAGQNSGIIPKLKETPERVYVVGGDIDVTGYVDVEGTVGIYDEVDVNISSVNGYDATSYSGGLLGVHDPN